MLRIKPYSLYLVVSLALIISSACNEPDNLGLDLQPEGSLPFLSTVDTFTILSYNVPEDSLIMWSTVKNAFEPPTFFLGSLNDPYVGETYAGFVSQVRLGNTISSTTFNGATTPDSIVLTFAYKAIVGDSAALHKISVYELAEKVYLDSTYYSARKYAKGNLIGHAELVPKLKDSVVVGGVNRAPQLRIALDTAFGGKILRQYIADPSSFSSSTNFLNFLNGIVLVDSADGTGSIVTLNSTSTLDRMTIYYSNTLSYDFVIDVNGVRMSYFDHKYINTNTDNVSDDLMVIQSMAGMKDSLIIPYLSLLYKDGPVSIGSAQLVFKVDPASATTGFDPHSNMLIFASDSVGKNVSIIDASEASSYFGGSYSSTNQEYTFNIARHVQQTLTKIVEEGGKDYGLFLVAGGSTSNAQRTLLKGNSSIKLIVTYSKFNQ